MCAAGVCGFGSLAKVSCASVVGTLVPAVAAAGHREVMGTMIGSLHRGVESVGEAGRGPVLSVLAFRSRSIRRSG
jgi:hypothetical protein